MQTSPTTAHPVAPKETDSWRGVWPVVLFSVLGVLCLCIATYRVPDDTRLVGMVFPFGWSEDQILKRVASSGGRVLRFGGFGHMAVVARDDGAPPRPEDFGAWFAMSPLVSSICAQPIEKPVAF